MSKLLWLLPAAFLTQGVFVRWIASGERTPAVPDLSRAVAEIGHWRPVGDDLVAGDVRAQLRADSIVSRTYQSRPGGPPTNLMIAWFRSQRAGAGQPHSPQVCLPGAGWTPIVQDRIRIAAEGAAIPVNRSVIVNRGRTAVVLYWYQTPRRAVANEWLSKLWTVWDAAVLRRTDIALVRVVAWPDGDGQATAAAEAAAFVQAMHPRLLAAMASD